MRVVLLMGALFSALVLPFAFFAAIFEWIDCGLLTSVAAVSATSLPDFIDFPVDRLW